MDESYEFAHNKQVYPGDPEYKKILCKKIFITDNEKE